MLLNYKNLEKRVNDLECEIQLMKQEKNNDKLLIKGVPATTNNECLEAVLNIAKSLNVNLNKDDVVDAIPIPVKKTQWLNIRILST